MARHTCICQANIEDFISAKISSGKYNSASEVIRTALRLLEAEELKNKNQIITIITAKPLSLVIIN